MGEFAALEVKVEAIEIPPPVMVVMVVVMRWRMAGGGGGSSVVFRLHFILYTGNEREVGRSWGRMENEAR